MHHTVDMHTAINKINVPDFVREVRGPHEEYLAREKQRCV